MYKKHGRDQETSLELQVKALVVKALEEQGLSMEPRILVTPPGELALVGSPLKVLSSQGDENMTPSDTTIVYKVSSFLHLHSVFGTIHLVPHVHVI